MLLGCPGTNKGCLVSYYEERGEKFVTSLRSSSPSKGEAQVAGERSSDWATITRWKALVRMRSRPSALLTVDCRLGGRAVQVQVQDQVQVQVQDQVQVAAEQPAARIPTTRGRSIIRMRPRPNALSTVDCRLSTVDWVSYRSRSRSRSRTRSRSRSRSRFQESNQQHGFRRLAGGRSSECDHAPTRSRLSTVDWVGGRDLHPATCILYPGGWAVGLSTHAQLDSDRYFRHSYVGWRQR